MDQFLTAADARVLGALIEKQVTTPDNYPLSLNALVSACNQTTNRYPVVSYNDEIVLAAIQRLRRASLVRGIQRIDSRVTKYEHTTGDTLNLTSNEVGVVCVLLLRGPNTLGELKARTERLATFTGLDELETTLNGLIDRDVDPLVIRLPRQPGQKEARYAHLLSGEVTVEAVPSPPGASPASSPPAEIDATPSNELEAKQDDRIASLEQVVAELKAEISEMREQLEEFRKQFE